MYLDWDTTLFSGIISAIGHLIDVTKVGESDVTAHISPSSTAILSGLQEGSSIACSGVCLTVVQKFPEYFSVNISAETLRATNLQQWITGTKVNLEPSLRVGAPLDGHMVQGHVDCVGTIQSITRVAGSHLIEISCDSSQEKYLAHKGSVAIDGVSLTINNSCPGKFSVNIVPYTWSNTTFQYKQVGNTVNIETDLIARYLEALHTAPKEREV